MKPVGTEWKVFPTTDKVVEAAAAELLRLSNAAIEKNGRCSISLSGGETPKALYQRLSEAPYDSRMPWSRIHWFWGDERAVPQSDPQSNFLMVKEALLSKVDVPADNIHPVVVAPPTPEQAAELYQQELKKYFAGQAPVFDIALMGLGTDGHTASLFPGVTERSRSGRWVEAFFVPKMNAHRISIREEVFNQSRQIFFLVTGTGKAEMVGKILGGSARTDEFPAQWIVPSRGGKVTWLLDEAAAQSLV